jgi:hypothetical protein
MTLPSGTSRVFLCGFRVSTCHGATVTRRCTTGEPDTYKCATCGANTTTRDG